MPCIQEFRSTLSDNYHRKIQVSKLSQIQFARKVANEMGYELISYLDCGSYGSAYKITGHRVLKITTDINEVHTVKKILEDHNNYNYIAKYYEVKKIESVYLLTKDVYAIIMDYLFVLTDQKTCCFFDYFLNNFDYSEQFFKENLFDSGVIQDRVNYYKSNNLRNLLCESNINKYIDNLKKIASDVKRSGIYPVDIHSGNLGSKYIDDYLVYFDLGANKNYTITSIETINII